MNPNRFRLVMNAARGALLTVVAAGNAHAQAPTSPPPNVRQQGEQLERLQQDREEAQRRQLQASPSALTPPASEQRRPWPEAESPCRAIQAVALVGDSSEAFRWVLSDLIAGPDPAIGRCLGVAGVNVAAERAQQALMTRGFVTSRIVFEGQNLASGRLTLTLLPGRIRAIRFATPDDRATAWNAVPAQPGDVLNLRDVEQALENFKRVPTAEADIQIEPADVPGQSDLVISWRQSLPFRLNVTLDDSGSKATGRYQGSATLSHDHGLTLNDLFYVTVNRDLGGGQAGDRGTQGHTVHYSLPWDYGLLGFTQAASRYHQSVAGLNQDYTYSGQNDSAALVVGQWPQPILRHAHRDHVQLHPLPVLPGQSREHPERRAAGDARRQHRASRGGRARPQRLGVSRSSRWLRRELRCARAHLGTTGPITVPNSAMFQPANAGSRYLIESDPRFTDYRQWLGSDYMFAALGSDPNALQKRLGDGFYEQRLVREQVGQLTGRRFLEGHASDEAQFQALMDAGITYAQAHQLVPGVALSAEQMAQLTTDLVWLVEREVVLPDGSKTTPLPAMGRVRRCATRQPITSGPTTTRWTLVTHRKAERRSHWLATPRMELAAV